MSSNRKKAAEALTTLLEQLKLYENANASTSCENKEDKLPEQTAQIVCINRTSEKALFNTLTHVYGLGPKSISKIIAERAVNGDFLSPQDFDRRVKGVRYKRLHSQCKAANVIVSLAPSNCDQNQLDLLTHTKKERCNGVRQYSATQGENILCIASWNADRISRHSSFYGQKVQHLLRFVTESDVDVLLLQELCRGVPFDLRSRLADEFRLPWETYPSHGLTGEGADCSLGLLYRADRVFVSPIRLSDLEEARSHPASFQRQPQMAIVRHRGSGLSSTLAILHVHLHNMDPRSEIEKLAHLASALRKAAGTETSSDVIVLLAGDFNLNSDSLVFDVLRQNHFVEVVRPPGPLSPHPYTTLSSKTTIGGQWFDNFWVPERHRRCVADAWCFDFGGRQRNLHQSSHDFAVERRCRSSDHLPVAIKMRLAREDSENEAHQSQDGP